MRIKNKGSQNRKRGPKRATYESLQKEHPDTDQDFPEPERYIQTMLKLKNAVLRRKSRAFRRRTNTYAKTKKGLQRALDVQQVIHHFVRPHWTTRKVPAVLLGIISKPFTLENILSMQRTV